MYNERNAESSLLHDEESNHFRVRPQRVVQDSVMLLPLSDSQGDDNHKLEPDTNQQFIGDLNPAARLLDEAGPQAEHQVTSPSEVGVWIQKRPDGHANPTVTLPSLTLDQQAKQHQSSVSDIIAMEHIHSLSNIYFTTIHPILPVLNEEEYREALERKIIPVALVHAVCLIAAKDEKAMPYLQILVLPGLMITVRAFCAKLHASVMNAIKGQSPMGKVNLIRTLCLLSLHHEGENGSEQASSHIAMACHHAQTLAMHLRRPGDNNEAGMKQLFWCVWTLDRLNAAINSRPCVLCDDDIGIDQPKPGESASAAFDIWFMTSKILNRVIALYRPNVPEDTTGIELEYSGFEQLVDEMEGWSLSLPTLATLRIFFLATAILACRLRTIRALPATTAPRLRQQLAAVQIIRQMQHSDRLNSLCALPVIVYGASLASSVSYQQLRYSKLFMEQDEALMDFRTSCNVLKTLQHKWSSADAMATLTQKVSVELEKIPNLTVLCVDNGPNQNDGIRQSHLPGENSVGIIPEASESGLQEIEKTDGTPAPGNHTFSWNSESNDIFGGMDDMSWMYLDAENLFQRNSLSHLPM